MWDRWEVSDNESFTLQQFLDRLKKKYGFTPMGVVQGSTMIYMPMPMYKKKLDTPLVQLLKETESGKYDMVVSFSDSAGKNVEGVPVVRFIKKDKKVASKKSGKSEKKTKGSSSSKKKASAAGEEKKSRRKKSSSDKDKKISSTEKKSSGDRNRSKSSTKKTIGERAGEKRTKDVRPEPNK